MSIRISIPEANDMKPKIAVLGVGGAGGNAVNNMIQSNLEGVEFWVANTDAQALEHALTPNRLQLGAKSTRGLGAGSHPEVGRSSAEESMDDLSGILDGTNMVFITAGMGGGTGTGAAPVVAKAAKERGILTVGVVTKPFHFEGARRMKVAELGLEEMNKFVDTLIVIPNQNLFRLATENTTFADAFKMADNVLHSGVRGITDLITMPGLINLDFADIRTVMSEMGKAMMGTGEAEGEDRAILAAEAAISNPLLDNTSMKGARGVLINITGGSDMTLFQVDAAANRIREEVDPNANIIFGSAFNPELNGKIRVSLVATGIDARTAVKPIADIVSKPVEEVLSFSMPEAIVGKVSNDSVSEIVDESFIPAKPSEPNLFEANHFEEESHLDSEPAIDEPVTNDFDEALKRAAAIAQGAGARQAANESAPQPAQQEKAKDDFFDIPSFLRKKIKF